MVVFTLGIYSGTVIGFIVQYRLNGNSKPIRGDISFKKKSVRISFFYDPLYSIVFAKRGDYDDLRIGKPMFGPERKVFSRGNGAIGRWRQSNIHQQYIVRLCLCSLNKALQCRITVVSGIYYQFPAITENPFQSISITFNNHRIVFDYQNGNFFFHVDSRFGQWDNNFIAFYIYITIKVRFTLLIQGRF